MTWNYRIAKKKHKQSNCYEFFVVEAFYNKKGEIWGVSSTPRYVYTDQPIRGSNKQAIESLMKQHNMMLEAFNQPIINVDKHKWGKDD